MGRCRRRRSKKRLRGTRRLFWRVYIYGLLLLGLVSFSVGAANYLLGPRAGQPWRNYERIVGYADEELTPLLDQPEALQTKIDRAHRGFGLDIAIYTPQAQLLAAAGNTPAALDEAPTKPAWLHRGAALPLGGGRAYAVARWEGAGLNAIFVPLVVLIVLALVSFPLVRNIVRPIEKITKAARAVGEGQLDARTGVSRRDEVGTLAKAFDDMAARLERLVTGEKELRANVSHELRTPLARARVALEIAEEGRDPETIQKHLRGIRRDIIDLEELVDQVLISARLDLATEDDLGIRASEVDLRSLVVRSAEKFRSAHPDHTLDVEGNAPLAHADAKLTARVIDNLLENSAKYAAPTDGVITLTLGETPGFVTVTVADRGMGVSEEELGHLFEPFFRADSVRLQNKKGVGLGLSFCRRVVEAHGGEITARRRDGGGLVVRFTLVSAASASGPTDQPSAT